MTAPIDEEARLFRLVREIADPSLQRQRLECECGSDVVLRDRVERLLRADSVSDFPPPTFPDTEKGLSTVLMEGVGASVGPYLLVRVLGEGGMGVVFLAEQQTPIRRQVAVKVIRAGVESPHFMMRFEAERQALAMMNHAGIAKVHDAGVTSAGVPYLVMELIEGAPITRVCDADRLTVRQRLELFASVCDAVQHAHQKGVIHRDLKPGNVLVSRTEGGWQPKIIDFGVAKALAEPLVAGLVETHRGQWAGTIEYMAPEQLLHEGQGIDTRADLYALGVVLYELLAGVTPFDRRRASSLLDLSRRICEEEPARPSRRIGRNEALAESRRSTARQLQQELGHDLDAIVLKSLEKSPDRRYASASELAEDVRSYLTGKPIRARTMGRWERATRLMRRHRGTVAALLMTALALIAVVVDRQVQNSRLQRALADVQNRLYVSDVQQAWRAWSDANYGKFIEIVHKYADGQPDSEVRGSEWGALYHRAHRDGRELALLPGPSYHASFSPDGQRVAVVGLNAVARILEYPSGRELHAWPTGQREVNSAAFSDDGSDLWTAGDDGTLRRWEIETEKETLNFEAHDGQQAFKVLLVAPLNLLVSCGTEPTIRLWDASTGESRGVLTGHTGAVQTICLHPLRNEVASASDDGTVRVWNLERREQLHEIEIADRASAVAYSRDGKLLAMAGRSVEGPATLRIVNAGSGELVVRRNCSESQADICFNPDGDCLVSLSSKGHANIFTLELNRYKDLGEAPVDKRSPHLASWSTGLRRGFALIPSPDGQTILTLGTGGAVSAWTRPWDRLHQFRDRLADGASRFAFLPGGMSLVANRDRGVGIHSIRDIKVKTRALPGNRPVVELDVSPDGSRFATADNRHQIQIWNCEAATPFRERVIEREANPVGTLSFSHDGLRIAISDDRGDEVSIANVRTGQVERRLSVPKTRVVRCSPRAPVLVCSRDESEVEAYSLLTGEKLWSAPGAVSLAPAMAISPDGNWLVIGTPASEIRIYDMANGRLVFARHGHETRIECVSISHDSRTAASISEGGELLIWRVETGELLYDVICRKRKKGRHHCCFSPDGGWLAHTIGREYGRKGNDVIRFLNLTVPGSE